MPDNLQEKVEKALQRSGYPLEMHVAQQFRKGGFDVAQAEFYEDPTSKQQREIDVVATHSDKIGDDTVRLVFAIECKSSREKPWVMFVGHPSSRNERQWRWQFATGSTANRRGSALRFEIAASIDDLPIFSDERAPAYGMVQLTLKEGKDDKEDKDRKDLSYAATAQAIKAAVAITKEIGGETANSLWAALQNAQASIGFPIVVLDGHLFTARLEEDGALIVGPASTHALMVRNPDIGGVLGSQLFVVTKDALPMFVKSLRQSCDEIFAWLGRNRAALDKAFRPPRHGE